MPHGFEFVFVALGALAAGFVNALAGGGTLISFPVLIATGIPPIAANVTNTVALSPGYFGATMAQSKDLRGQGRRLRLLIPAAALGGIAGGLLLLDTGERAFRTLIPFLILAASALLAVQSPLRRWLDRRTAAARPGAKTVSRSWIALPVGLAAVYGGYFGAGLSVIVLAVLALLVNDSLTRLNALKQAIAFSTNIAAAVFFLFSGRVVWPAAFVMAGGALLGGSLGGRVAGRVPPTVLRTIVVLIGLAVGIVYLVR